MGERTEANTLCKLTSQGLRIEEILENEDTPLASGVPFALIENECLEGRISEF